MIQRVQTLWMLATSALVGSMIRWESQTFWFLMLLAITTLLPLVTIFLYKNRPRQVSLMAAGFLPLVGSAAFGVYYAWFTHTAWSYTPMFLLTALLTNYLAIRAILRDEMKVRAADRIR